MSSSSHNVQEKELNLHDIIGFFLGNRTVLFVGCVIGLLLGAGYALTQLPMYRANVTLQFNESSKKSSAGMDGLFDLNKGSSMELAIPVLLSRNVAEEVVKKLALNAELENVSDVGFIKSFQRRIRRAINPPESLMYMGWSGSMRYYLAKFVGDPGPIGSVVLRNLEVESSLRNYELILELLPNSSGLRVLDANRVLKASCLVDDLCEVVFNEGKVSFVAEDVKAGHATTLLMHFSSLENAAARVRGSLDVAPLNRTSKNYLSIDCKWTDPYQGALILNALTDAYDVYDRKTATRSYDQMIDFLDKSIGPAQQVLERSERELRAFLTKHNMFDMKFQYDQGAKHISDYDQQQMEIELEKRQLTYVHEVLGKADFSAYGSLLPEVSQNLAEQWKLLQEKSVELALAGESLSSYTELYPPKKKHILSVQLLEEHKLELKNKAQRVILDRQALLTQKRRSLDQMSNQVQQGLGLDADTQIEYFQLQRKKEISEKLFVLMQSKREEMRITKAGETTSMQVLDSPLTGVQVSPNLPKSGILGAIFGLILAGLWAFVRSKLDLAMRNPSDIERLTGLYVHGVIPRHKEMDSDEDVLVTIVRPTSVEAEAYRSLRTSIQLASLENQVKSIMITSSGPGEGKSTTMCNLAVTLAQSGRKTLIIDCDMRRPTVNKRFAVERDPGLSEILTSKLDWRVGVRPSGVEGLFVLPSGTIPPNPSELIGHAYMAEILAEMKAEYDFVLCDVPPILVVSDAALLAAHLDGVLILVRSGLAIPQNVARAREQMVRVGGKVLGGVFNAYESGGSGQYGYSQYGYSQYGYSQYVHTETEEEARAVTFKDKLDEKLKKITRFFIKK